MVRGGPVVYIFHPSLFPRFTVFNDVLKIGFICVKDGAEISPKEDVAVLDRYILYLRQVGAAKELQWNSDITLPGYNAFPPFTLFFLGPLGKAHKSNVCFSRIKRSWI